MPLIAYETQEREALTELSARWEEVRDLPGRVMRAVAALALALAFASSAEASRVGADPGFRHRCVWTISDPIAADECGEGEGRARWTFVVQSEASPLIGSCPGPFARSFPLGGPVGLAWAPLWNGWEATISVDHRSAPHPCGPGHFTFAAMMDHREHGGGRLPRVEQLASDHRVSWALDAPAGDNAARALAGFQGWWRGKAHIVELNLAEQRWGDAHPHPGVIIHSRDWYGNGSAEYVLLDAAWWGIRPAEGMLHIAWGFLLGELERAGFLEPVAKAPNVTQAVYLGVEAKGRASASLSHSGFTIWRRPLYD